MNNKTKNVKIEWLRKAKFCSEEGVSSDSVWGGDEGNNGGVGSNGNDGSGSGGANVDGNGGVNDDYGGEGNEAGDDAEVGNNVEGNICGSTVESNDDINND